MNFAVVFAAVFLSASGAFGWGGPLVNLSYAQYEGVYNSTTGINAWFGIKYAVAPVGPLRWQAPVDIELNNNYSTAGAIYAGVVAPACVQGGQFWAVANGTEPAPSGQEDCLTLDVLTPANPKSASLPVMVQIHGGGYTQLSSEAYTPGFDIVQQSNGSMIYVSLQYRLGAYGFLSSAEIKQNGVANAGLLDQRAALQWVQRNVHSFGGDPSKVTVIGGSAGGGSVTNQLIMYGGVPNPPFRAAVAEYPWWQPYKNDTVLEYQYSSLLSITGCGNLACLRAVPEDTLAIATLQSYEVGYKNGIYGYGDYYYGPAVDGEIIRDLPSNEFKKGHFSKVPFLTDRDGYEGYIFNNMSITNVAAETADLQVLFPYAKPSFFNRLYELYPASDYNSTFWQLQTLFGDFIIDCPTYYMATAMSDYGLPVYKMIFNVPPATHASTVPYLWGASPSIALPPNLNMTLAAIMKDWFISFTTHLDPNAQSYSGVPKPYWPKYTEVAGGFSVMDVNQTMMGVTADFDASAQCDFFHGQSYVVRN